MFKAFCALIGAIFLLALPATASAQTTVASTRASYVTSISIASISSNGNTFTGVDGEGHRSYVEFAVPISATPFTSAVLRLNTATIFYGPQDLTVYDVTSDINTATALNLYNDLGSGMVLGSITGLNTSNQTIEITLNANGIAAANAARGGNLAFGFVSSPTGGAENGVFGSSDPSTLRQLVLSTTAVAPTPVPTLSEWAMILMGMTLAGGAVLMIQRRRMAT